MTVKGMNINRFAENAPALIAVCSNADEKNKKRHVMEFVPFDLGGLTSHLVLAAEAAGLSTCILGWRDEPKIRECLSLPEDVSIPVLVAIGYKTEGYETRKKARRVPTESIEYR